MYGYDEPPAQSPEEDGAVRCGVCGKYVPLEDYSDHLDEHSEVESLTATRPLPVDPVTRAFWQAWASSWKGNNT